MFKVALLNGLLLTLACCSGAWAESDSGYVQSLPVFHQPVDIWRARHSQNLARPQDRWRGLIAADLAQSCLACHRLETCLNCHQTQGGPNLRARLGPKANSIHLWAAASFDQPPENGWANCLSCHPQEAAWPGDLNRPQDPGEYLPAAPDFPCPAFKVLGGRVSLMNLSLKRAEYLTDPNRAGPLKAEASRLESLLAGPLALTRAEDLALGLQILEWRADNELARPALAAGERRHLLLLSSPFLIFGLLLAWRAFLRSRNQPDKPAQVYLGLSFIFFSLSLAGGAALLLGPDEFFYPLRPFPAPAGEGGGSLKGARLNRLLVLAELAGKRLKVQPRQSEPVEALAVAYQEIKSQLLQQASEGLNGPPWPPALAPWALIAKSAAEVKFGRSPASPGQAQGAEIWDDQVNWLFTLPDSPLKKAASLMLIKALAGSWPRLTEACPPALPERPAEELEKNRFSPLTRQHPAKGLMERLLTNLTEPEELASGLTAFGQGLGRAGALDEAARTFGRAYETALYIKNNPLKVSVFLDLGQAWGEFDPAAGNKALAETLAVAAAMDRKEGPRNHWTTARSLAKVARAWGRTNLPEALTMANDLRGDHEIWLTARAAAALALGTTLESVALQQYQSLNSKPVYQAYSPYLQSFDLKAAARGLASAAQGGAPNISIFAKMDILAWAGELALEAKELLNNDRPEEAEEIWRQAWTMARVTGNYQDNMTAVSLYRVIGDAVAEEQPAWAALAYHKAFEIMRLTKPADAP